MESGSQGAVEPSIEDKRHRAESETTERIINQWIERRSCRQRDALSPTPIEGNVAKEHFPWFDFILE